MNYELFDANYFNVLEDENNYYVFRALNREDHNDIINSYLEKAEAPARIRTDRERFEELHGTAKYNRDSEISLEEVYDHIKIHHIKETNCISLSSNSCVSLDYGGSYFGEYAIIKVPKDNSNPSIYPAGQYMLFELFIKIEETLKQKKIDPKIQQLIKIVENSNNSKEITTIISELVKTTNYEKNILSRFQDRQYFNKEQQLEYNKIIAKATILEVTGILPNILPEKDSNQSLIASIGMAFSSGELIHYNEIPKENFNFISKQMMNMISLTQQLKEKYPNNVNVLQLEKRIIDLINHGYDIKNVDGKTIITNGTDIINTGVLVDETEVLDSSMDSSLLSIEEIYNMTGGTISYDKAKKAVEFCYKLAKSKKEIYDYTNIVSAILGNNELTNELINSCFIIDSAIIDRSNNNGYKVCESVNIGLEKNGNKLYSLEEQRKLIGLIENMNINDLELIVDNRSLQFRNSIIENLPKNEILSKNEYYAISIIDSIDFNKVFKEETSEEYLKEVKEKLYKVLSQSNVSRLYSAFTKIELSHEEISYYIFNLFIEKRLKGYSFDEICELENIEEFAQENFSVFNRNINNLTLNNYLGLFYDSNYIPNSQINLRDFQQRIKNDVDSIYADNRRFAGVVLPTGGGKSFIAMAEMMERQDSKMLYVAPRNEILRNFKKNIVKYVADLDPEGLSDNELDVIVNSKFPYLELICYQSLSPNDEEKISSYKADFIILDEIHHIGGSSWNRVVKKLVDNNENAKVLGISATPQRDDYMNYEGDDYLDMYGGDMMLAMAAYLDDYSSEELVSKPYLACDMNVIDAIQEGYLVCPNIISFDYYLDERDDFQKVLKMVSQIKNPVERKKANEEVERLLSIINKAKLEGVDSIIKDHIKVQHGKYILFVPRKPPTYEGTTDEYIEECIEEFKRNIYAIDSEPHIDYIHSKRKDEINKEVMINFEVDNSDHMKVLVAIDMLNEGVHLPNINGSFNFRKIDSHHLILSLQHLGRVLYALDPQKEYTDSDIPVVFDKFNNYSNLDLDRLVNKKTVSSDLEKLKDVIFWMKKYGKVPSIDSPNVQETKKAVFIKRVQEKYKKFIDADLDKYNLSEYDKCNTRKIIELCNENDIWSINIGEISPERIRKIERVEMFNVSATEKKFIEICNNIKELAGISTLKKSDRIKLTLKILDILSENDIILNTETINQNTVIGDLLKNISDYERDNIMYEIVKLGMSENYPLGQEYYQCRTCLFVGNTIFLDYEYTLEEITNLRKYGLILNGSDYTFVDKDGFVINGPKALKRKNIWTGTYYGLNNGDMYGYDQYKFDVQKKIHADTHTRHNKHGFDINHINRQTKDIYDIHGFDINLIHKDTGTKLNPGGYDIDGNWYKKDPSTGKYSTQSYSKYNEEGKDIDGYNRRGFDENNIHRITGKPYDELFYGNDDMYWELSETGERVKTDHVYNDKWFDRRGYFYELDKATGKVICKGQVYNEYGFLKNRLHYKTMTPIDPDGYDIDGIWYKKGPDGKYISTGSIFNDKGWTRDKKTLRHNVYGSVYTENGDLFLDIVDDYGFDYKGRYHEPVDKIDKNGFVDYHKDIILYSDNIYHRNKVLGIYHDIHGFNQKGICSQTGTYLNPYGFDRNGYYWKKDENGELYNTYCYFNDEGWTIDRRKFITNRTGEKIYSVIDERGFDIDRLFRTSPTATPQKYDEYGFDYYEIHCHTGTHVDENNFDCYGYWWDINENGELVKTDSLYNSEGWSRQHTNIETLTIRDKHGFNYLHLYRYPSDGKNREGKLSEYDPHGFNYLGIHRVTGKVYNSNYFDIDGFWYKEIDGVYVKTNSKYDDQGLDIDRKDKHGFSKNAYTKGRKKTNDVGFMANGINIYTNLPYDFNGRNIDGEIAEDVNWPLLRELAYKHSMYNKKTIEEIKEECTWYEELLEAYDEDTNEFEGAEEELETFISYVITNGIKENNEFYTKEEIMDYVINDALKAKQKYYYEQLNDMYSDSDYDDIDLSDLRGIFNL